MILLSSHGVYKCLNGAPVTDMRVCLLFPHHILENSPQKYPVLTESIKLFFFYSRLFCILLTKIQYQKRPQRAIRLSTCTANHSRPPSWSLFFPLSSPSLCPRLVARGLRDDVITQPECQQRQNDLSWRDDAITQSSTYSTHPFIYFTLQIE